MHSIDDGLALIGECISDRATLRRVYKVLEDAVKHPEQPVELHFKPGFVSIGRRVNGERVVSLFFEPRRSRTQQRYG